MPTMLDEIGAQKGQCNTWCHLRKICEIGVCGMRLDNASAVLRPPVHSPELLSNVAIDVIVAGAARLS